MTYHPGKMESTFTVITCSKWSNVKYPTLEIHNFTNDLISSLLSKLQKESCKRIFLLHNCNFDLLKYELSDSISNFRYV